MPPDTRVPLKQVVLIAGPTGGPQTTFGRAHGLSSIRSSFPIAPRRRLEADGTVVTVPNGVRGGTLVFVVDSTDGADGTDRLLARICADSTAGSVGESWDFEIRLEGTGNGLPSCKSAGPATAELNVTQGITIWTVTITTAAAILEGTQ